ncbi:MAG: sugar phosphate nucleotidyltransferase [Firmicutes bacterium]|nr:sugar phosphate nucleotidyltransferase [Bacillota bacterium]
MSVKKAVIPAGGFGTRFLPITRAVPKEMLPIGDKPIIHYIIQELSDAGITDILILIGRGRECLVNYFDYHSELDLPLPFPNINITFKRVPKPLGAANCVYHSKDFVGGEDFLVAYSDNVFFGANPTKELLSSGANSVCVVEVPQKETHKYGIWDGTSIIEKPQNATSNLAGFGRYLLSPIIFDLIEQDMGGDGEVCMTQQLNKLAATGQLKAVKTCAMGFDIGNKVGWHQANLYALGTT